MPARETIQERERATMLDALAEVIERTWMGASAGDRAGALREFFAALDDDTLRAIGYQHGLYDYRPEHQREDRPDA